VPEDGSPQDPRFTALIDVLRRAGRNEWQLRYHDDEEPTVWLAVGRWPQGDEAGAGMTPYRAALRLAETVMDGGQCAFCEKPTGITDDWKAGMPLADVFCWWKWDPEVGKFRRGCEGEHDRRRFGWNPQTGQKVGRNEPCPCGSGKKWKHCHGKGK
jgi:hypothetical protein